MGRHRVSAKVGLLAKLALLAVEMTGLGWRLYDMESRSPRPADVMGGSEQRVPAAVEWRQRRASESSMARSIRRDDAESD
jgi:hypothetical protein